MVVARKPCLDLGAGAIGGPVVDHDDLEGERERRERRTEPFDRPANAAGFVERGNDDRDIEGT